MDTKRSTGKGIYIIVVLSMLFWGLSFVWSTIVFKYYDPITTIFFRLVLSTSILFLYLRIFRLTERISKKHFKLFMLSALFNPFFYFIGENFGLKLTTPTISAVVIATIPLVTPIAARLIIKEKLTILNYAGIFISFSGIVLMLIKPDMTLEANPGGIFLLLFAVISAVIYSVLVKKLVQLYRPVTIIAHQNLVGIFLFLPLFLIFGLDNFIRTKPTFELISALIELSVFASSLAFIFFTKAIRVLGVSRANVFSNLIPVFTGIFSYILVSETFSGQKITGMIIIMSGIIISQVRIRKTGLTST